MYGLRRDILRAIVALAVTLSLIILSPLSHGSTIHDDVEVVRVIDGDSFWARVTIWHKQTVEVNVRVDGIDTPEIRGAKCDAERAKGLDAKDALTKLLTAKVILANPTRDKYGRTLASVLAGGFDVADAMIEAGHARAYHGGKRKGWCE